MSELLFTGFPGFLGSALLPLVLARREGQTAVCIVQDRFLSQARSRLAELEAAHAHVRDRVELVVGDITVPGLGLPEELTTGFREVFHLAAVYDLAVPEDLARTVNIEGTRNVLALCADVADFRRLQYVSTVVVSGAHHGLFREADLDTGQTFTNHYEQTKFEAEVLVRAAIADGLPATIYRPGVVVGDSVTGETQKYDGPYYLAQFLTKQPHHAIVPRVAAPDQIQFSIVPRDFVVQGIDALSVLDVAVGKTYALTDPSAPTVKELVDTFCRLLDKEPHWVRVPLRITQAVVSLPGMERLLGFPEEGLVYFANPTVYDTSTATRDLTTDGLSCPAFSEYAPALMRFMSAHPEVSSAAMV